MSANLIKYETEQQRQDRRIDAHVNRAKQVRRNQIEWARRMSAAALAGNYIVARHILDTQFNLIGGV